MSRSAFVQVYTLVARAIRNTIRANRFARIIRNWNPYFHSASGQFAWITQISDSREPPDSRKSRESIRTNHATKVHTCTHAFFLACLPDSEDSVMNPRPMLHLSWGLVQEQGEECID